LSKRRPFSILPQPDGTTCGPTCLHAVYQHYGDRLSLDRVIREVPALKQGGTLAVFLACHALRRGYHARIYTFNLKVFDPSWFDGRQRVDLRAKLVAQAKQKHSPKLRRATKGYLEFLDLGGEIHFEDISRSLIRDALVHDRPILTGLSATYLYRMPREHGETGREDDIRGVPCGHFVVLCSYNRKKREVLVADPLDPNPLAKGHVYSIGVDRAIGAILLGVLTYDANMLIIEPRKIVRGRKAAK
jgi:hypothetical protein